MVYWALVMHTTMYSTYVQFVSPCIQTLPACVTYVRILPSLASSAFVVHTYVRVVRVYRKVLQLLQHREEINRVAEIN